MNPVTTRSTAEATESIGGAIAGSTAETICESISQEIENRRNLLLDYSHALHADPEISGDEHRAAERTRTILREAGFSFDDVQPSAPTALSARSGDSDFVVTFCVEYDALPDIGHACGHNVNAAAALGAALALAPLADRLGLTIHVLGTPSEETHGGKVDLIEEGFFTRTHAAAMAHASAYDSAGNSSLALNAWTASYTGVAAHAAGSPSSGTNALDAVHIAQTAIAVARQQLPPRSIVSTVISRGGDAINIIPDHTELIVEMRSPRSEDLDVINDRVEKCLRAGALATDCGIAIEAQGHTFADLRQNHDLVHAYVSAMADRGREIPTDAEAVASTDMGNVSHVVPSIHPLIGYEVDGAVNHNRAFAAHGTSASADLAVLDAAYGLARAMATAASDEALRSRLVEQHRARDIGA
ncbi:MAG: amidohydrolase [Brevibacterium sp.]|uniref:amidohydrolase n=1 Tax=Brevibacterium sp. TaxID=1701 RepID=UPI002649FDED|nr:amidohydrolase [Brevibacterium sp.]MDN5833531.1 amidohydrolase [Brevibacterium sp.]MDN6134920.1 amidohydrolase [Brevibacterium sp.]MDN6159011.1 amidohydrolase [Brevibacterium sp.]MDN6176348.1 amidohydrolase [Brevibacterium sp.]MDN6188668.1 amidohydrolase [Brevibacterium sp.]